MAYAGLLMAPGCQQADIIAEQEMVESGLKGGSYDCIEFESFSAGDFVTSASTVGGLGPVVISATNPLFPADNAAMIFDSSSPTGGDDDLGTPNAAFAGPGIGIGGASGTFVNDVPRGNILIISEDLDASDPDDADEVGANITFDFSSCGSATLHQVTILDVDGESDHVRDSIA